MDSLSEENLENHLESKIENDLECKLESDLETNLKSELESTLENNLESTFEGELESDLGSKLKRNLESKSESKFERKLESEFRSYVRLWRYCYFKKLSILSQLKLINFWRLNCLKNYFQDHFFQKIKKIRNIFFEKTFGEKIFNIFIKKYWKIYENIKIFENIWKKYSTSSSIIFQNWSMAVGIWLFFVKLQVLTTRMCSTQTKHWVSLNDSSHQNHWTEI